MKRVIMVLLVLVLVLSVFVAAGGVALANKPDEVGNHNHGGGGNGNGATGDIEIFNFYFSPDSLPVTVSLSDLGDTSKDVYVTWVNRKGNHDVTSHEWGIMSGDLTKGETFSLNISQLVQDFGLGSGYLPSYLRLTFLFLICYPVKNWLYLVISHHRFFKPHLSPHNLVDFIQEVAVVITGFIKE